MVLVATERCISSLIGPPPHSGAAGTNAAAEPFLYALDIRYLDMDEHQSEDEDVENPVDGGLAGEGDSRDPEDIIEEEVNDDFPGYFKVAVDYLLIEFFRSIADGGLAPEEIWPFANPLYKGV